jgi:hypothetical protein
LEEAFSQLWATGKLAWARIFRILDPYQCAGGLRLAEAGLQMALARTSIEGAYLTETASARL